MYKNTLLKDLKDIRVRIEDANTDLITCITEYKCKVKALNILEMRQIKEGQILNKLHSIYQTEQFDSWITKQMEEKE